MLEPLFSVFMCAVILVNIITNSFAVFMRMVNAIVLIRPIHEWNFNHSLSLCVMLNHSLLVMSICIFVVAELKLLLLFILVFAASFFVGCRSKLRSMFLLQMVDRQVMSLVRLAGYPLHSLSVLLLLKGKR